MSELNKLVNEVEIEFSFLEETINDIKELLTLVSDKTPNRIELAASSQFLSQYYNGLENILKRVVKYNKISLPSSDNWHTELLYIFDKNSNYQKIPLFDVEEITALIRYKKIRHVVRQGYNFILTGINNI